MNIPMLDQEIVAGNQLWQVLAFFGVILAAFIVGKALSVFLKARGESLLKSDNVIVGATAISFAKFSVFTLFAFALKFALALLTIPDGAAGIITPLSSVIVAIAVAYALFWLVDVPYEKLRRIAEGTESKMDDMLLPIVRKSMRVTIIVLALVQIAQILSDKPITSILAGLGIGGLAVALAAQESIRNFFGSLMIFADKPFELGDRINVDGHDGPVEEVGLRSTKIRTLEGHLVTIPNGELANKTIQNIGKRPHIRRLMNLTITYDTPPEKIDEAINILKELLENHEGMHPDFPPRVNFNNFNDCSLNILVIYWYHPPSYWDYMAFSEKLNKEIFRRFGEAGIDFAFPTQTTYLAGDENRPLKIGLTEASK